MLKKTVPWIFLLLLAAANEGVPFNRFSNYTSVIRVNDFAMDGDLLWCATSGGLFAYKLAEKTGTLYSDASIFPDPYCTALCLDTQHSLWIGTGNGYLYKKSGSDRQSVYSSYRMAGWSITDIASYGKYLIIGSNKGCSVFDTDKKIAVKNATSFGNAFPNPQVITIAIFQDTLFLGFENGIAKLNIAGARLMEANFYDPSIWSIDSSGPFPVRSFLLQTGAQKALSTHGTMFNGKVITDVTEKNPSNGSLNSGIFADTAKIATLPSMVTAIGAHSTRQECYFGTAENYFYIWDGQTFRNVTIDGPTFTTVKRVLVDHEGMAWICPEISACPDPNLACDNPWWEGISAWGGGRWWVSSPSVIPSMGTIKGNGNFLGVAEDRIGNVWFGTPGGQVKKFDRQNRSWSKYCVGAQTFGNGRFYPSLHCDDPDWAKSDAVACDSTPGIGYVWIAVWNNFFGSLLCYDPRYVPNPDAADPVSAHYRWFFPNNVSAMDPLWDGNLGCLCVDAANTIFAGSGADGGGQKLVVLRHNGNPLGDGIQIIATITGIGNVLDAATTPDTITRFATTSGLYTYDPRTSRLLKGLWALSLVNDKFIMKPLDTTLSGIQTIEAEDEGVVWLGTANNGLIRYDLVNNSATTVDETNGLLSNSVVDLSFDRKNGYLWIATDRGVSRYSIGYAIDRVNNGTVEVYPNPFSKRRHTELVFQKLLPSSKVAIYTASGNLVTTLSQEQSSAHGSFCVWKPPSRIVPGLYLYSIRSGSKSKQGKLMVTP